MVFVGRPPTAAPAVIAGQQTLSEALHSGQVASVSPGTDGSTIVRYTNGTTATFNNTGGMTNYTGASNVPGFDTYTRTATGVTYTAASGARLTQTNGNWHWTAPPKPPTAPVPPNPGK